MLGVYAAVNVVLGLIAVTRPGWFGVGCLLTTSLFMSIMFPTIFALGLKGMGEKTKTAGSLLVMAILGGAALTKIMGMLADSRGAAGCIHGAGGLLRGGGSVCVAVGGRTGGEQSCKLGGLDNCRSLRLRSGGLSTTVALAIFAQDDRKFLG